MRYKSLLQDKLISVSNGLKTIKFHAERGEIGQLRLVEEKIQDTIEEIQSLINTQDENHG